MNVDAQGNNVVGDAANEPSIAVDPTDHNRMAIGWREFTTITSSFRQAGNAYTDDSCIPMRLKRSERLLSMSIS